MKTANIFESIPDGSEDEVVDILLKNKNVSIERIVSKGHTSPATGWFDQKKAEWVLVLKGAAIISFIDDSDISMKAGDHILIPAHKKHRVKWTDSETETVWLAVHY